MPKTTQKKFDEYLLECAETSDAVNEFINNSYENYQSFAYAAGVLSVTLKEVIAELPRARRVDVRERLYDLAQVQKNELLVKKLKVA